MRPLTRARQWGLFFCLGDMVIRYKFRGSWYEVRFEPKHKKMWGSCNISDKVITFYGDQKDKRFLETAIHEALHACLNDISEEAVERTGADIARFLRRLGFRREA